MKVLQTSALPLGYVAIRALLTKESEFNERTRERQYSAVESRTMTRVAAVQATPVFVDGDATTLRHAAREARFPASYPQREEILFAGIDREPHAMIREASLEQPTELAPSVGPRTSAAMRRGSAAGGGGATQKLPRRRHGR